MNHYKQDAGVSKGNTFHLHLQRYSCCKGACVMISAHNFSDNTLISYPLQTIITSNYVTYN